MKANNIGVSTPPVWGIRHFPGWILTLLAYTAWSTLCNLVLTSVVCEFQQDWVVSEINSCFWCSIYLKMYNLLNLLTADAS